MGSMKSALIVSIRLLPLLIRVVVSCDDVPTATRNGRYGEAMSLRFEWTYSSIMTEWPVLDLAVTFDVNLPARLWMARCDSLMC
jgi:hypothetical protein